jgi:DNA-binding transcriptional regulator YiaG
MRQIILRAMRVPLFDTEQTARSDGETICLLMSAENAYTRTMRRAIQSLGSVERVAQALGVTVADVEAWAAGHSNPPPSAFLKAIDIVALPGNSSMYS